MNAKEVVTQILAKRERIDQVYWVACGASWIDMYPAHCLLQKESTTMESRCAISAEFLEAFPKKIGKHTLLVTCSHSGNTKETLDIAKKAQEAGALVLAMTNHPGSKIDQPNYLVWAYDWGNDAKVINIPSGVTLTLAAELLFAQESYNALDELYNGIEKMDTILKEARNQVNQGFAQDFAKMCEKHNFFYILGSGPTFAQTYAMGICSMMEMQRQNCCYLNSAEYFHGPFECTEPGVFYFMQKSSGSNRVIDERADTFLKNHTDAYMVLDALDYGMQIINIKVRPYLDPILFYAMSVELRIARGKQFDHDPDSRRYMGIIAY